MVELSEMLILLLALRCITIPVVYVVLDVQANFENHCKKVTATKNHKWHFENFENKRHDQDGGYIRLVQVLIVCKLWIVLNNFFQLFLLPLFEPSKEEVDVKIT